MITQKDIRLIDLGSIKFSILFCFAYFVVEYHWNRIL